MPCLALGSGLRRGGSLGEASRVGVRAIVSFGEAQHPLAALGHPLVVGPKDAFEALGVTISPRRSR